MSAKSPPYGIHGRGFYVTTERHVSVTDLFPPEVWKRDFLFVIYPEHFKLTETLNNPTHPQDKKKHEQWRFFFFSVTVITFFFWCRIIRINSLSVNTGRFVAVSLVRMHATASTQEYLFSGPNTSWQHFTGVVVTIITTKKNILFLYVSNNHHINTLFWPFGQQ